MAKFSRLLSVPSSLKPAEDSLLGKWKYMVNDSLFCPPPDGKVICQISVEVREYGNGRAAATQQTENAAVSFGPKIVKSTRSFAYRNHLIFLLTSPLFIFFGRVLISAFNPSEYE